MECDFVLGVVSGHSNVSHLTCFPAVSWLLGLTVYQVTVQPALSEIRACGQDHNGDDWIQIMCWAGEWIYTFLGDGMVI